MTANGGLLTKHALCIYSAKPPPDRFLWADLQKEVDAMPRRTVAVDHHGATTIESYVVMYGENGPSLAHAACLTDEGQRTWANVEDPDTVEAMLYEEFCGHSGRIDGNGRLTL